MRSARDDQPRGGSFRSRLAVTAAIVAGTGLIGAAALAAIPDAAGVIHGCYENKGAKSGDLRVIDPADQSCTNHETAISWSQSGPEGLAGPQGPEGQQGPQGPAGAGGDAFFAEVGDEFIQLEGAGDVPVVSVPVPAGSYAVFAKTSIISFEPTSIGARCTLSTGNSSVARFPDQSPVGAENLSQVLSVQDAVTLTAPSTLVLTCAAGPGTAVATLAAITAIQVGAVH